MTFARRHLLLAAAGAAVIRPARAQQIAPDVVVLCEPTLAPALRTVGNSWTSRSRVRVRVFGAPSSAVVEELARNVRADVVVLMPDSVADALRTRNLVRTGALRQLGADSLVLAGRAAGNPVQLASAQALADIVAHRRLAIVDPAFAVAGLATQALLEGTAVSNVIGAATEADAIDLLRSGSADEAILFATDVAANSDLHLISTFGAKARLGVIAGVAAVSRSPNTQAFFDYLCSPDAQPLLAASGLQTSSS